MTSCICSKPDCAICNPPMEPRRSIGVVEIETTKMEIDPHMANARALFDAPTLASEAGTRGALKERRRWFEAAAKVKDALNMLARMTPGEIKAIDFAIARIDEVIGKAVPE